MTFFELLTDPTFQTVALGTSLVGAISGGLGCFAYLRQQSLVGDVIAHSSLFGVMIFFLASYWLTGQGSKSLLVLVPGAIFAGILSLVINSWLLRHCRVRPDSSLGVMLALFFGGGIFLLRWVQRTTPTIPGKSGLEGYLFGQAALMTRNDLTMICTIGLIAVALMLIFWKELKVFTFDPVFSQTSGYRFNLLDLLLITLTVLAIVIGIQSIGVVLMIAMLITPAAAARQWTKSLGSMVCLAAGIGAVSGCVGSVLSASINNAPTGPVIILVCVFLFVISICLAPQRGVISSRIFRSRAAGDSP